jgi:hypothetical protein
MAGLGKRNGLPALEPDWKSAVVVAIRDVTRGSQGPSRDKGRAKAAEPPSLFFEKNQTGEASPNAPPVLGQTRRAVKFYLNAITPKVPAKLLLGPAVKNKWFLAPLVGVPPPNSIPQSWSIWITFPLVSLIVPTN